MLNPTLMDQILEIFSLELYRLPFNETAEEFLVERAFIDYFYDQDITDIEIGTVKRIFIGPTASQTNDVPHFTIRLHSLHEGNHTILSFIYSTGKISPNAGHGLMIIDDKYHQLYDRKTGQNPQSEWNVNALTDDITDEEGNIIFPEKRRNP